MKNRFKKGLALLIGAALTIGSLTACGKEPAASVDSSSTEASVSVEKTDAEPVVETNEEEKVLVVGYDYFSSKFNRLHL